MKVFGIDVNSTRLPIWLSILIAILILLSLWDFWLSFSTLKPTPSISRDITAIKPIVNIAELHLFGRYDVGLSDLPETNLQLKLQGTLVNQQNKNFSIAIISSAKKPAKVYKIGQSIPGDAIIKEILKDEVIIDNNGTLESLRLPKLKLKLS